LAISKFQTQDSSLDNGSTISELVELEFRQEGNLAPCVRADRASAGSSEK
jgi:hypothetical protein